MTDLFLTALGLLVLLQVKHLFADYFLQTARMLSGRDEYLHLGRVQHAGLHAAFSLLAFLIVGATLVPALLICLAEGIVHYHIDWAKGRHGAARAYGPQDAGFWRAFGVDQFAHQITYVAMIWLWGAYAL